MTAEDERRPATPEHQIGCDLSGLSVGEIDQRITLLTREIDRLKAERETKALGRRTADSLFRF